MGFKTFEELRQTWVVWARQSVQELQSQAEAVNLSHLPDSSSTDTSA